MAFALYPILRPYSDDALAAEGGPAFASSRWVLANSLAMLALILLPLGLAGAWLSTPAGRSRAVAVAAAVAGGVQLAFFGLGLLSLAVAGVLLAIATWRAGQLARTAATVLAVALVLYLPQFYAPPAVRVAHGVLFGIGAVALAWAMRRGTWFTPQGTVSP